ncbi:gamma-glutamylcyclotransferase family protein [Candidatus Oscillochloris fontis]|uniref:gamma-glutamylcyclotransferase family protein n=1 Tax=Candidatus Oscillochloris fontis TaxID=2496868 RepID=UPI001EE7FC1F|nr:gamma-glutamylcyclotransferase family protein [Candidatus Oscillochloris fontis]
MYYPFFVYGTLKPGEPNYTRLLAGRIVGEESATLAGAALYTAGPFPFMVREPDLVVPGDRVFGALITVAAEQYATMMVDLDQLEAYTEGGRANMYERILLPVETTTGPRTAWVYLAGREALAQIRAGQMRRISEGEWRSDAAALAYWRKQ